MHNTSLYCFKMMKKKNLKKRNKKKKQQTALTVTATATVYNFLHACSDFSVKLLPQFSLFRCMYLIHRMVLLNDFYLVKFYGHGYHLQAHTITHNHTHTHTCINDTHTLCWSASGYLKQSINFNGNFIKVPPRHTQNSKIHQQLTDLF